MSALNFDSDWDCYDHDENERARKEAQDEYDADFADCYESDKDDPCYPW